MSGDEGGGASGDAWAFSEANDWKYGRHRRDSSHIPWHAGEVEHVRARRTMTAMRQAFERTARRGDLPDLDGLSPEEMPARIEETDTFQELREAFGTEAFSQAVGEGDASVLRHFVGSQEETPDLSSIRTLQTIEDLVCRDAAMFYVFGHMGTGKSFLASLFAELWTHWQGDGAKVASNTRTIEAADWVRSWPELRDWMHEDQETVLAGEQTPKLFIFDEASSQASGRGSDGYEASTKLATMVYKIRKHGGSMIVVGHDGKDVAPAVRELCTAIEKTGKKTAQVFESVNNRSGIDPITPPLEGIPVPDKRWQPNTNDTADWSWYAVGKEDDGPDLDEKDVEAVAMWTIVQGREQEEPVGYRELAKSTPWDHSTCSRRYNDYEDEGKYADLVQQVESVIA